MISYNHNTGRIEVSIKFNFSPRRWYRTTKWYYTYLTNAKVRDLRKRRQKAWEDGCKEMFDQAMYEALFDNPSGKELESLKEEVAEALFDDSTKPKGE